MPSSTSKTAKYLINLLFWLALALGILLRFSYLDSKVFWHDETYTQLRVSGYQEADPFEAYNHQIVSRDELLEFQTVSERQNVFDTLSSLRQNVHVPLYYVLLRYWQQLWGSSSITAIRSFSAIWGSLFLLAVYLLTKKLFERQEVAQITTSLAAVSPMMIRYSQDARPYSLWLFCGVFSTYALLVALEKNAFKSWLLYGFSIVASCYTQLLSLYLYIGHGLYVLITKGTKFKTLVSYAAASIVGVLFFLPWLLTVVLPNFDSIQVQTAWLKMPLAFKQLLREQVTNLNHLFLSLDFGERNLGRYSLGILLGGLVIYSFYILITQEAIARWSMPLTLSLSSYVFLYQDLVLGGQRTRINQYFLFSYLAIFIAVGFMLGNKLLFSTKFQQKLYSIIYASIIIVALFTNIQTAAKPTWWGWSAFQVDMAEIINQSTNPLIISQERIGNLMPLFYQLNEDSQALKLEPEPQSLPERIEQYEHVFLLNPVDEIESICGRELDLVYQYQEGLIDIKLYKANSE